MSTRQKPFAEHTPWWRSIVTRTVLVFTVLVVSAAALAGYLVYRAVREQVQLTARVDLRHDLDLTEVRLRAFMDLIGNDIAFLGNNDPVLHFAADTLGDSLVHVATIEHVALLMESFLRSRDQLAQVRLLATDSLGMELVRFDRADDRVVRVPGSALQAKGDRDYYREAMLLGPGEFYFSRIDLNREHGRLSLPLMPTLRAATALFGPDGRKVGLMIINADLRPLFAELIAGRRSRETLVLLREDDEIILHPDTALMFRSEFAAPSTLDALLGRPLPPNDSVALIGDRYWTFRSFALPPLPYTLRVGLATDTAPLLAALRERRDRAVLLTLGIALGFMLLGLVFARSLAGRLDRITLQVERYAAGEGTDRLPSRRHDEVGRLARSLERMQQRIDERVADLQQARAVAEDADRARREFMANMSHDVRNPLQAILGMADAIDHAHLSVADSERVAIVQRSAQRLHGLVDDLLLHARIDAGRARVQATEVDVHTLFSDIAQAHRTEAERKHLALRLDLVSAPQRFATDPLHLHRIADNLVGNAVKFTAEGHVDVRVRAEKVGGIAHLVVSIADSGVGIAAEEQERMFQRFERAQDEGVGAGLGLAITRRLVELLGGTIRLESRVGEGSRFTVEIPEQAIAVATPSVAQAFDLRGLRVLHVDDVSTNRALRDRMGRRAAMDLDQLCDFQGSPGRVRRGPLRLDADRHRSRWRYARHRTGDAYSWPCETPLRAHARCHRFCGHRSIGGDPGRQA
ncbi:MAG: sensor histidine kinase [Flavobacteriales bacterium]|nr:sensor histidine kinase [Flavobacteriales bacterium]